jgi:hypothetical protein
MKLAASVIGGLQAAPERAALTGTEGETRIHTETATFELRGSEIANPRAGDTLTVGGETVVVQGEPERRAPDRLVWTLDARPA